MAHRNFARAMRRKTQWAGFGSATGTAVLPDWQDVAANTSVILSQGTVIGSALGFVEEEVTITRMIGDIAYGINSDTADANASIAIGCMVVRSPALAAGVGSLPSLEDDPDSDWLYYGVFGVRTPVTIAANVQPIAQGISGGRFHLDVRGQRILKTGESVVWLAEAQNAACLAFVGGRYLVKLT